MKRLAALVVLLGALVAPAFARAATEVAITSPAAGAHSLSGIVPVTISASATAGVYSVQLKVDGVAVGAPDLTPDAPYTYVIPWNTAGVAMGNHVLTATALDWSLPFGGVATDSAPVVVDVGPAYPTVTITAPPAWSFLRSSTTLTATTTGGLAPLRVQFDVDGAPLTTSTTAPWTAYWSPTVEGTHVITASVTDGRGKSATDSRTVTYDRTKPTAKITQPATQWTYVSSVVNVQATASDTSGVASVQFLLDGVPVGAVRTAPDTGTQYTYSASIPVTGASGSQHRVAIRALDRAGNTATSPSVYFLLATAPPTAKVTSPVDWSFVRGVTLVTGTAQGGTPPYSLRLVVDSKALSQYATTAPYTIQWDTRAFAAGSHTVQLSVTDSTGRGSTSPAVRVTVDNVPPSVALNSPVSGAGFVTTMPASATVSDLNGVANVQFAIDGVRVGPLLTASDAGTLYTYSATLSLTGIAAGTHSVTVVAVDRAGNTATSPPTYVTVGATTPRATITLPPDWSYARAVTPVWVSVTGGTPPITVRLVVDGKATTLTTSTSPYVLSWNTVGTLDGSHTLQASVTDAAARGSTSTGIHVTVDNTPASAYLISPTANQRVSGVVRLSAHASDAYGVRSVQFSVDGAAAGSPITSPDAGAPYTYSRNYDTTPLAAGLHSVTATVTDNAGNVATLPAVSIRTGPIEYMPVLNYHEIDPPNGYAIYDQTPEEADAQLAYLRSHGYQSVTLAQYSSWLAGEDIGIAKPVLITVDDGLKSELAWDALLQRYGFNAVLFVVTGYADGTTPAGNDPNNMTWADIQALAATGRWEIALHAGQYGHGDSYGSGVPIGSQSYTSACPYFYSCLSQSRSGSTWVQESVTAFQTAVSAEISAARTELQQKVPSAAATTAWAAPFNDAGQWTNLYNDASGQVQAWLPGYLASQFSLVFTQTSPVLYGQAPGLVGSLTGFNRHYRFEVHTDTTIEQYAQSLVDPAFAR